PRSRMSGYIVRKRYPAYGSPVGTRPFARALIRAWDRPPGDVIPVPEPSHAGPSHAAIDAQVSMCSVGSRLSRPHGVIRGQSGRRIRKGHAVACAVLIGLASTPAVAGHINWPRAGLFGDVVVRPPRAIPNPRAIGRSAVVMPRARPAAAPAAAPVAIKADG